MNKKSSHDWEAKEVLIYCCCVLSDFGALQEEWAKENFYFQQMEQKEAMEEKMQKIEKLSVKVVTCKEVCHYYFLHIVHFIVTPPLSVVTQQSMPVSGAERMDTISCTRERKRDFSCVHHVIIKLYHLTDILQNLASKTTTLLLLFNYLFIVRKCNGTSFKKSGMFKVSICCYLPVLDQ